MEPFLARNSRNHFGGGPPNCRLLDATHVQNSIVEVLENATVRGLAQERSIAMNTVACQQARPGLGDEAFDVVEKASGGLFVGGIGGEARSGQARLSVRADAPFVHLLEGSFGVMDVGFPADWIGHGELRVGDEARNGHDGVSVRIQSCHLRRDSDSRSEKGTTTYGV